MTPVTMQPKRLVQTAVAAFEEAMRTQSRPVTLIRFITDTARQAAEDELEHAPEAPARQAFATAFYTVSVTVRRLLDDTGHLPDTINHIRDEAHRRARQVDADISPDAERSQFIRQARELLGQSAPPDK